jgi:hypothetical protein
VVADTPALIAAAAGVGRRYPLSKLARLSGLAGVAHVMVSLALGAVIVIVGLQLRDRIESAQSTIIGLIQIRGAWLERWGNVFTALVLVAIVVLVLTGIL